MSEHLMTPAEAAAALGVSLGFLARMRRTGRIGCVEMPAERAGQVPLPSLAGQRFHCRWDGATAPARRRSTGARRAAPRAQQGAGPAAGLPRVDAAARGVVTTPSWLPAHLDEVAAATDRARHESECAAVLAMCLARGEREAAEALGLLTPGRPARVARVAQQPVDIPRTTWDVDRWVCPRGHRTGCESCRRGTHARRPHENGCPQGHGPRLCQTCAERVRRLWRLGRTA